MPSFTDYLSNTNTSSIYLSDCTSEEVLNVISELQNGKSSDVPIHVVKASSKIISPEDLEDLLENDRPVSTLAIFGKIFEKIIFSRLYSFMTSQKILYENQFGFRKQHSTNHAINYSVTHIKKLTREKNHVLGIFIDLSKTFDTISHEKLLCKLYKYGIRGNTHTLIGSYLSNRE